jgi:hypothetical protein
LGADLLIGRRLHELLDDAGVLEIGVEARADVPPAGHPRRTVVLDLLQAMRSKVVAAGLLTADEHEHLDSAARAHLCAPGTIVVPHLCFLAWGRVGEAVR